MAYSREEQETTLIYDGLTGEWLVYSTVPKHIRKLLEISEDGDVSAAEHGKDGEIIAVQGTLKEKQVSMKKQRILTEEQRKELSDRMRKMHDAKGE